jgi:hypothetical protein
MAHHLRAKVYSIALLSVLTFISLSSAVADEPASSGGSSSSSSAPSEAEVEQFRTWLVDAWNKQDVEQILTQVTRDIVVTWQDGSVSQGKDNVRKYIEAKSKGPNSVVQRVTAKPVVDGRKYFQDQIFSWGHMNDVFVLRQDGVELPFDSRFSAVLVRQEGKLLLAGIHFSVNVFDNPVQTLAMKQTRNFAGGAGVLVGVLSVLIALRLLKKSA